MKTPRAVTTTTKKTTPTPRKTTAKAAKATTVKSVTKATSVTTPVPPTTTTVLTPVKRTHLFDEWNSVVHEQGIAFRHKDLLVGSLEFMHIVYDIDLDNVVKQGERLCTSIRHHQSQLPASTHSHQVYLALEKYQKDCQHLTESLEDSYDVWIKGHDTHVSHRQPRQLFLGLGLLALGIIAVASVYFNHMSLASISVGAGTNPATIMSVKAHEKRLNIDEANIERISKGLKKLTLQVNNNTLDIEELSNLEQFQISFYQQYHLFQHLTESLEKLHYGRLSPKLVKTKAIARRYKEMIRLAKASNMKPVINSPEEIYNCETSYLVFKNKTIRAIVHVPLYKTGTLMHLYEYLDLPLKLNRSFMRFKPAATHIAINNERTLYRTLEPRDLAACHRMSHILYCKNSNHYTRVQHTDCLHALFSNDAHYIGENCQVQVSSPGDMLYQLSPKDFLVYHHSESTVTIDRKSVV